MEKTNTDNFRTNLKTWLEAANSEPIKITRKTGESYILVNSDEFEKMQIELANLRGVAQGLSDVIHGRTKPATVISAKSAIERAKERALGKKTKKAVG